jgi:hypothetical protein
VKTNSETGRVWVECPSSDREPSPTRALYCARLRDTELEATRTNGFFRALGGAGSSRNPGVAYPTAPAAAMLISIRRFISTAYSIGSSLTMGSMNPATIIDVAWSSVRPRDMR